VNFSILWGGGTWIVQKGKRKLHPSRKATKRKKNLNPQGGGGMLLSQRNNKACQQRAKKKKKVSEGGGKARSPEKKLREG